MNSNKQVLCATFKSYLKNDKREEAKALVNRDNATFEYNAVNFVWLTCYLGCGDDPDLITHLVEMGAPLLLTNNGDFTCLSAATFKKKPKIVRKLLDLGVDPDTKNASNDTTLDRCGMWDVSLEVQKSVLHIIDAGASVSRYKHANWVIALWDRRLRVRSQAVAILGLQQCGSRVIGFNGKDVLRVIGRAVWGERSNPLFTDGEIQQFRFG